MTAIKFKRELVINTQFGGYSLSGAASAEIAKRCGLELVEEGGMVFVKDTPYLAVRDVVARDNEHLVAVVRQMGDAANGQSSKLKIVQVECTIEVTDHDGRESVEVYGSAK